MENAEMHADQYSEIRIGMPWGHIAGRWYGDQQRRPILALHGWLDNCGTYAKLAPLLASYSSVLCIDFPGHGYSTHLPPGIGYHDMDFVRCIARIREIYNWQRITLMGHSMGAYTAYLYAALYPQRVDMIIGLDSISPASYEIGSIPDIMQYTVERALDFNERLLAVSPMQEPPTYTHAECEQLLYEGSNQSVALENCHFLLERNINKSQKYPDKYYFSRDSRLKMLWEMYPSDGLQEAMALCIARAQLPHLVIKGEATRNLNSMLNVNAEIMAKNNENFEQHIVSGATHHLHLNNAQEVAIIINKFLHKHDRCMEVNDEHSMSKSKL